MHSERYHDEDSELFVPWHRIINVGLLHSCVPKTYYPGFEIADRSFCPRSTLAPLRCTDHVLSHLALFLLAALLRLSNDKQSISALKGSLSMVGDKVRSKVVASRWHASAGSMA